MTEKEKRNSDKRDILITILLILLFLLGIGLGLYLFAGDFFRTELPNQENTEQFVDTLKKCLPFSSKENDEKPKAENSDSEDLRDRLFFPPNNYVIEKEKLPEVNFVWKMERNEKSSIRFELSDKEDFSDIIFTQNPEKNWLNLDKLPEGKYFWRIRSEEDASKVSEPRSFSVKESFSAPKLISPAENSKLTVTKGKPTRFEWEKVDGAKSYNFNLFRADNKDEPIFETKVQDEKFGLDMSSFGGGDYVLSLQANTPESEESTEISGEIGEYAFKVDDEIIVELKRPVLTAPKHKIIYNAKTLTNMSLIQFRWNKVVGANSYVITIKNSRGKIVFSQNVGNATKYNFKRLSSLYRGKFTWNVEARLVSKTNKILSRSTSYSAEFNIDIPILEDIKLDSAGELYGF